HRAEAGPQHSPGSDPRGRNGADLSETLLPFARCRYQSLVAGLLHNLYSHWRDQLADPLKELAFCRNRLTELLSRFAPGPPPETPSGTLLPEGCHTIEDAVQLYLNTIDFQTLRELDGQIQAMIERQFTSLAHVCLTSSDLMLNLEAAMLQLARGYMQERIGEADVAEMFLARAADTEVARGELVRAFARAEPELESPDSPQDGI